MILLIIWDGLRPDSIADENTPFLYRMADRGVFCRNSHAVFPTSTRINAASLTTGCYPGRHGIVDNELYVPALNSHEAVSCADWRALKALSDLEGGRLLEATTIGEIVRAAGKKMVSAGSGSPGTTYLTNPLVTGPVVNWALAWPEEVIGVIEERCGSFLSSESTSFERSSFVIDVVQNYLLPQHNPDLVTVWITEPDHSQHRYGLGSPEAKAALKRIDEQLGRLVGDLERNGYGRDLTCFVISDHGFNTVSGTVDPRAELVAAGLRGISEPGDVVVTSNSIYLRDGTRESLGDVLRFLQNRDWVGSLFLRDDRAGDFSGVMPQDSIFTSHRRSGEIMFSYGWSAEPNRYGVPGSAQSFVGYHGMHGSASPYDINNSLVVWGKGVKEGVVSEVPCGIVDIAPTLLHLLEIGIPGEMDGRVLKELLEGYPSPDKVDITRESVQSTYETERGEKRQVAHYSIVEGRTYLDQVTLGSPYRDHKSDIKV